MRIALVSYECPPDTALGGIGTYTLQAARALLARGHDVEVFAASPTRDGRQVVQGVPVFRVRHEVRESFRQAVAPVFAERHRVRPFDLLEGPEYNADAAGAAAAAPEVPLVVRLHTPTYLTRRFAQPAAGDAAGRIKQWRIRFGAYRRGWVLHDSPTHPSIAHEREHALCADRIVSPSNALARRVSGDWGVPAARLAVVPNPFAVAPACAALAPGGDGRTVVFVGRLEVLKGVLDLADAIPRVLRRVPQARFRFVGRAMASPQPGVAMDDYLRTRLHAHGDRLEWAGVVAPEAVPQHLAGAQVCVLPSHWESFGYACLEAMSAARAVVAGDGSGMAELLAHGRAGVLVPVRSPVRLAAALVALLQSPEECIRLGLAARERVRQAYDPAAVCALQERAYREAISHRRERGPRVEAALAALPA